MAKKPKFKPEITRVKLNPEQAVLSCGCYDTGTAGLEGSWWYCPRDAVTPWCWGRTRQEGSACLQLGWTAYEYRTQMFYGQVTSS